MGLYEPGDTYNWAGAKIMAPWDMKLVSQDGACRSDGEPALHQRCTACWVAARTAAERGAPDASIRGAPCQRAEAPAEKANAKCGLGSSPEPEGVFGPKKTLVDIVVDGSEQERGLHFENILPQVQGDKREIETTSFLTLRENNHFFKK